MLSSGYISLFGWTRYDRNTWFNQLHFHKRLLIYQWMYWWFKMSVLMAQREAGPAMRQRAGHSSQVACLNWDSHFSTNVGLHVWNGCFIIVPYFQRQRHYFLSCNCYDLTPFPWGSQTILIIKTVLSAEQRMGAILNSRSPDGKDTIEWGITELLWQCYSSYKEAMQCFAFDIMTSSAPSQTFFCSLIFFSTLKIWI